MDFSKGKFLDFDVYNEFLEGWDIKFNLLSKNDFSAEINMFMSDSFFFSREKLNGKLIQKGVGLKGFRTIVIPVKRELDIDYFGKKVSGDQMLIFPKDNSFEAISYSNIDIYVLTIREDRLLEIFDNVGYSNCRLIFNGEIKELYISKEFTNRFHILADIFLKTPISNPLRQESYINKIIDFLLKYIEHNDHDIKGVQYGKRDLALKKTVEIINDNTEELFTVRQLCGIVGVSQRTLEYAFKDKYRVSPSEYIKAIRLNNVKNELYNLRTQKVNIASVAGKYNFWHMGQFAKDFRKQFGVLPSEIISKF